MKFAHVLTMAAMTAAGFVMLGCEVDESLPNTRRDFRTNDAAEKRELEAPKRDLPTGGREFPGQSQVKPAAGTEVATLSTWKIPEEQYRKQYKSGPLPHQPEKPAAVPTPGSTPVEGTPWSVEHSWGEVLPLANYPHRNFPDTAVTYVDGAVKHNPTYHWTPQVNSGSAAIDTLVEAPWFYINTLAMPALMVIDHPWSVKTSGRKGEDPVYHGHLPASGGIAPTAQPGEIRYEYNFYKAETRPAK